MEERKYSIKKIISHDYATLLSFICFVIMAVFLAEIYFIGYSFSKRSFELVYIPAEERFLSYYIFGSFCLIELVGFILRMNIIKSYFRNGIVVKGTITELMYWRDRGRITFKYNMEGSEHIGNLTIHTTKATANLGKNDEVKVLVKQENHKKAIIMDIFEDNQ